MRNKIARQRGLPVEETEEIPEDEEAIEHLPSHLFWIWEAFATLSRTRVVNQTGPQPILPSEILSYCQLLRITDEFEHRDLLFHITDLDILWLKDQFAKMEKSRTEAKKEAEKNAKKPRGRRRGRV